MPWATAVADVRTVLSDGPTDKLRWHKDVLGLQDGVNVNFKTFEARRISPLVGSNGAPIGVFINNVLVSTSSEDLESGLFVLSVAPINGALVRATYYIQWFDDAEIQQFLTTASEWISGADDWTQLPNNLWPAAKTFSAASGFQKLSLRFATNMAETFQLYDSPDQKRFDPVTAYSKIANDMFKLAFELRDDVYKNRQGQALAPIARSIRGRVRDVPPNR